MGRTGNSSEVCSATHGLLGFEVGRENRDLGLVACIDTEGHAGLPCTSYFHWHKTALFVADYLT